ncbi:MAG TPA: hypothetical protein PKD83_04890 [Ignavibacteria bacterium]|nr:hypothetical protein [Ignavibacteria bacterium]
MKFPGEKINFRNIIIVLLFSLTGVLGYLYYDLHSTNIKDRELIKLTQEENLDLSQDLEIYKDKFYNLSKEYKTLKSKTVTASYKKKFYKKRYLSSAGISSKHKFKSSGKKISYKKLYFQLKYKCEKGKTKINKQRNYKRYR